MSDPKGDKLFVNLSAAQTKRRLITDLEEVGPVSAYRLLKRREPNCGLNLLWAMAAGLAGKDWRELSEEEKSSLIRELEEE